MVIKDASFKMGLTDFRHFYSTKNTHNMYQDTHMTVSFLRRIMSQSSHTDIWTPVSHNYKEKYSQDNLNHQTMEHLSQLGISWTRVISPVLNLMGSLFNYRLKKKASYNTNSYSTPRNILFPILIIWPNHGNKVERGILSVRKKSFKAWFLHQKMQRHPCWWDAAESSWCTGSVLSGNSGINSSTLQVWMQKVSLSVPLLTCNLLICRSCLKGPAEEPC